MKKTNKRHEIKNFYAETFTKPATNRQSVTNNE